MAVQSVNQDCYPGREKYVARVRCDGCGTTKDVAGDGNATDHRVRKIIARSGWVSEPDRFDTRKRPGRLDYCPDCQW